MVSLDLPCGETQLGMLSGNAEDTMSLQVGERLPDTLERARWRGTDAVTGGTVSITISHEALKDEGEAACLSKACEKYKSPSTSVDVTTVDF